MRDVVKVLDKVKGNKDNLQKDLLTCLRVPDNKRSPARVAASWWIGCSHAPSWAKLTGLLISCQEREALKVAKDFLPTAPPGMYSGNGSG